jgi:hypothetical protein
MMRRIIYKYDGERLRCISNLSVMQCVECGGPIDHRTESYYVHTGVGPVCLRDGERLNRVRAARGEQRLPLQRT